MVNHLLKHRDRALKTQQLSYSSPSTSETSQSRKENFLKTPYNQVKVAYKATKEASLDSRAAVTGAKVPAEKSIPEEEEEFGGIAMIIIVFFFPRGSYNQSIRGNPARRLQIQVPHLKDPPTIFNSKPQRPRLSAIPGNGFLA
ncbi:hypothetical protein M0R45_027028 [Rubus argutus]|uniref:Uncharacterized protein n=1 Tax=Rubus argutus TaxID=59490 RepID=A0AAW1WZ83_RUBAR